MQPRYLCLAVGILFATAASAWAQPPAPDSNWGHGTTVNLFGGFSSGSSTTGPLAGGAFGWEITPAFAVEARGTWLDRGHNADAFTADLGVQVGLTPPQHVVPFVEAAIGFYHATFGPGAAMPAFYRQRMAANGPVTPPQRQSFNDTSFVFGGGINFYINRQLAIRPDVNAIIVHHGNNHVLTTFAVHFAYHFEPHPLISTAHRLAP
jgi:hypothetical protein